VQGARRYTVGMEEHNTMTEEQRELAELRHKAREKERRWMLEVRRVIDRLGKKERS